MTNLLTAVIAIAIVVVIAKFILHVGAGAIIGLIINAVIGYAILWLLNLTGIVAIPLTIVTSLVAGVFGIPGVVVLIILAVLGII